MEKTDAELIAEVEAPLVMLSGNERPDLVEIIVQSRRLAQELARRLKAANERCAELQEELDYEYTKAPEPPHP